MKNLLRNLIYFIVPIFFGLTAIYLYNLRGPHYIQIPQDLAYQNVFNALNIIEGKAPGMLLYPAVTLNYLYVIIIKIVHLFYNENIIDFSLKNIELLCKIFSYITSVLLIFLIILIGIIFKKKDIPLFLIIFFQSSLLFVGPLELLLNLYVSAESILLILGMLLIILVKIYEENYNLKFVFLSSIVCSLALLTKLSAAPFFILPLLLVGNFKFSLNLIIISVLFSVLLLFLIILPFGNTEYIYQLIRGFYFGIKHIISSASVERSSSSGDFFTSIISQQVIIFQHYSLSFYLFFFNLILIAFFKIKKIKLPKNIYLYILFIVIYYFYLSLRPKPHYFLIIQLFSFFLIVETIYFFSKNQPVLNKFNNIFSLFLLLIILVNSYFFINNPFLKQLEISKDDVKKIRSLYEEEIENKALITAVQASDKGSGFYHANDMRLHLKNIIKIIPKNEFNYNFDSAYADNFYGDILTQEYNRHNINDIIKKYKKVYFWSSQDKFKYIVNDNIPLTQRVPNLLYKDLYNGQWETIAEIIGVQKDELKIKEKKCQDKFCYDFLLKDHEKYNGLGIKFNKIEHKLSDNFMDILVNNNVEIDPIIYTGPWNNNNFSQYVFKEKYIKNIKIISKIKIDKLYTYQNINSFISNFEYLPINVLQKNSSSYFYPVKQYDFWINNKDEIIFNFEKKIKPKFIELNQISKLVYLKVSLYGLENDGTFKLIESKKRNDHHITFELKTLNNKYSSYKFHFDFKSLVKDVDYGFILNTKNKLKEFLSDYNSEQANILFINFIY